LDYRQVARSAGGGVQDRGWSNQPAIRLRVAEKKKTAAAVGGGEGLPQSASFAMRAADSYDNYRADERKDFFKAGKNFQGKVTEKINFYEC
jgi:hypothetical protein